MLNRSIANGIEFANPSMKITAQNSYGLPVSLDLNSMSVYSKVNNNTTAINPITFNFGTETDYLKAENYISIIDRKGKDSLLFKALFNAPEKFSFRATIKTNPSGVASKNVVYDTSKVVAKVRFELPLWFRSKGFGQTDTMDFSLFENNNSVKKMMFLISAENGMPIDFNLQVYFVDANYKKLDSMFHTNSEIVKSAKLRDNDDVVSEPTSNLSTITFDSNQITNLQKTKKLLIKVNLKTGYYPTRYVKFLTSYKLKLSFSCQFQAKVVYN